MSSKEQTERIKIPEIEIEVPKIKVDIPLIDVEIPDNLSILDVEIKENKSSDDIHLGIFYLSKNKNIGNLIIKIKKEVYKWKIKFLSIFLL